MVTKKNSSKEHKPTWWQMTLSVLAAMFGVQKNQNRERDFQFGNPAIFIILGIIMVTLFVFGVIAVVKLVLLYAGPGS